MKFRKRLKKFYDESIINIPGHVAVAQVDIWFQDEARFGQQNTTTRVWAKKGSRPRVVRQQQFQWVHIFGAVCPSTGKTEAIISPYMDTEIMTKHMDQISQATEYGRHALVIVDGASWHNEKTIEDIENVSILKLPPYSPELNPIEQVWQWMRQNELANRCFKNYDDIVEQVSRAWNSFRSSTERVNTMCTREWATLIT